MNVDEYKENKKRMQYWEAIVGDDPHAETTLARVLNEYRQWPRTKKREGFYPSDAERCSRELWYILSGVEPSNGEYADEQINTFSIGDAIEKMVVEKYKRLPGTVWEQVGGGYYLPGYEEPETWHTNIATRPKMTYYMDLIWHDKEGMVLGEPTDIIVEVKSAAQFPFKSSRDKHREYTWYGVDQIPKTDHYTQAQLYMWGEDKDFALLHYVNKNNGDEQVWLLRRDDDYLAELFAKLETIYHRVASGEMPDRPFEAYPSRDGTRLLKGTKVGGKYRKTYWRCLYCSMANRCWELKGYEGDDSGAIADDNELRPKEETE